MELYGIHWNPLPFFQLFLQGWAYLRPYLTFDSLTHEAATTSCKKNAILAPNAALQTAIIPKILMTPISGEFKILGLGTLVNSISWYEGIRSLFSPRMKSIPTSNHCAVHCAFRFQYASIRSWTFRNFQEVFSIANQIHPNSSSKCSIS